AAEALGKLGSPAVTALTSALKDKGNDVSVRTKAAEGLGHIGPAAGSAVPVLITALKDKDVRTEAATALGSIGPAAKAAIPDLTEATTKKNKDKTFKKAASEALKKIQPESK